MKNKKHRVRSIFLLAQGSKNPNGVIINMLPITFIADKTLAFIENVLSKMILTSS